MSVQPHSARVTRQHGNNCDEHPRSTTAAKHENESDEAQHGHAHEGDRGTASQEQQYHCARMGTKTMKTSMTTYKKTIKARSHQDEHPERHQLRENRDRAKNMHMDTAEAPKQG